MGWKIWVLRAFFVLFVLVDLVMVGSAIRSMWGGDISDIVSAMEFEGDILPNAEVPKISMLFAVLVLLGYLAIIITLFRAIDRLLVSAKTNGLATKTAARSLRIMGHMLVALWGFLIVVETVLPIILFLPATPELSVEFYPFDLKAVLVLIGMSLWLLARLADEAREMKEELASVV